MVESLFVRGLGHQCNLWLLSCALLMMQLSLWHAIATSYKEDITKATMKCKQVTAKRDLTISFPETKLLVAGTGITEVDVAP